ncbi:BppU family phage baseplate upper protein [Lactococcus lactis]|uniref:BppU family phage baseplate upper protein n=1 Tax=Lactococcus lactis TaxID=1358 RepID=UPI0018C57687|nr:BppU family phage baseplate upper protein [Lactococcus lactis]MBG1279444.1 DUF2479 domain-containing protein [Lactococcus lactis subsp. lactis]
MSDYSVTLSTTEPNNYVGLIKLRQGDVASQLIQATITANGQLFKFDHLAVFFNAVLPNGNVVRDKVTKIDYANSKLNYIVADSFLQEVAQVTAWFSFENDEKIIDSTKNFQYSVIGGWKKCIPQGNYIYELSEIQREIEEIISNKDFTSIFSKISSIEKKYDEQLAEKVNKDEVANGLTAKGAALYANLPTTRNTVGDYYYCSDGDETHGAGNYVWNGTAFYFGGTGDQGYNILKDDLDELGITPIKNLVKVIDKGHYWGNTGILTVNAGYDAVTIEVEGGKSYSINKEFNGGDNFNLIEDAAGNVIGKYTSAIVSTIGNGWYITVPANTKYLKLTSGITSYLDDFIIVDGVRDISKWVISDYPINTIKRSHLNYPLELKSNVIVDDKFNEIDSDFNDVNSILGGFVYQYIDKTKYIDGHWWGYDPNALKVGLNVNQYFNCISIIGLSAGEYKISKDYNAPFTVIENIDTKNCYLIGNYITSSGSNYANIKVDFDFNLYLTIDSWRSKDLFMLCDGDGEMPTSYMYGKYDMNLSKAFIKNKLPIIIYCGVSRDYTTLKSAIEEATKYMDSIVYVDNGIYDLVEEFGTTYLDSYNGTDNIGLVLKNRVKVVFSSGAKVVFDYQGTNKKVHEYFSPFNSGEYGGTLENVWVESKNCRYSVHDERAHASDSYHNAYKKCTFIHDSSSASGWHASQAIGGGLGRYGDILIEDCYCSSKSNDDTISYHSTTYAESGNDAKSKIVVKNTYTSGTLNFIQLGNSSEKAPILVSGCNLRIAPKIEGSVETMDLIAWGNTIREP